jgi:crotonobetainyl-CoA:carnitine CoA-transferase CaiB-like acyl-CoA transferase
VIKIEPLEGEPMRTQQAFPEAGAMKVLQGKESVALDLGSPQAAAVLARIAERADIVMCSFRAGAAERLGVDYEALRRANPSIMYLDCPGFGVLPPYGRRPAFAPTIAAGSGIARRAGGTQIPDGFPADHDEARHTAIKLFTSGGNTAAQPDGIAALAVGTALSMSAYLQAIGVPGQPLLTTMLHSCAHALGEIMVEFEGRWEPTTADHDLHGISAVRGIYRARTGWVTVDAVTEQDWSALAALLGACVLDARFSTESLRIDHDAELRALLEEEFLKVDAQEWEDRALVVDAPLMAVNEGAFESEVIGPMAVEQGWVARVESPIVGEYPRLAPYQSFSRSRTQARPGSVLGQHTRAVLTEVGYSADEIDEFARTGLVLLA